MKNRLLYVVTLADMGGAQNHVLELVRVFRDDFDVEVAVGNTGYMTERLTEMGVTFHVVEQMKRNISPINDAKGVGALRRLFKDRKPDIVHAHSAKAGLLTRIAAWLEGIRNVYSVHGWGFDMGVGTLRKMIVWPVEFSALVFTDQMVTPTQYDKNLAMKSLRASGKYITVIPYGIAEKEGRAQAHVPTDRPIIIMPARFNEQKDQMSLIRAADKLADETFEVWLIGDGPNRGACEDLVRSLGLEDKVKFLGMRRDLDDLLVQSHIFCLATHYEGMPLSIMEAMRCSLPVVATDVSGISEEIVDGQTGFLAGHESADDLAEGLGKLIRDVALREKMGTAGRDRFYAEYSNKIMRQRMGALYDTLLKERG